MTDKLQFIKNVDLFLDIPEQNIHDLLETMKMRSYPTGKDIIREGESGNSLFILFEGNVSVTKKMTLFADYQEQSRVDKALIRLKDSDYALFGEMSLCGEEEVRSATVTAESDCQLGELPAREIFRLVKLYPEFGTTFYRNLSNVLANRLRKANRDILKLTTALTLALEES